MQIAKEHFGVRRSVKGSTKKFTHMKQQYSAFQAKIVQSGRNGDDEGLYEMPDFFREMHEMERDKACFVTEQRNGGHCVGYSRN